MLISLQKEQAARAQNAFHDYIFHGRRFKVYAHGRHRSNFYKIHGTVVEAMDIFTGRDQGSARGTNFEEVRVPVEFLLIPKRLIEIFRNKKVIFRKAILGKYDRKLWVPTHSFR